MLVARYPHEPTAAIARDLGLSEHAVYSKAHDLGLRKGPAFRAWQAERNRERARTDARIRAVLFHPGHVPANKGIKGWQSGGRSRETWFKRGQVSRRWDPEIYIVGALRVTSNGVLQIKVATGARGWVGLAQYEWAMHHRGRLPPRGRVLRHRNGDAHDCAIGNLELVTCAENIRRNSIHNLPRPLARVILLQGALHRELRRRTERQAA